MRLPVLCGRALWPCRSMNSTMAALSALPSARPGPGSTRPLEWRRTKRRQAAGSGGTRAALQRWHLSWGFL